MSQKNEAEGDPRVAEAEGRDTEVMAETAEAEPVGPEPADETAQPGQTLDEARAEAQSNWDRYLRVAAELDNLRRRSQLELEKAHKFALEGFVGELLTVCDSFEMGLQAAEGAESGPLLEGLQATYRQLTQVLEKFGVTEVDPAGEPFDPDLHEAISVQASDEVAPDAVLTVVQKGYQLNGRLVRPARVIVARS